MSFNSLHLRIEYTNSEDWSAYASVACYMFLFIILGKKTLTKMFYQNPLVTSECISRLKKNDRVSHETDATNATAGLAKGV